MKTFSNKLPSALNLPITWTDEDWAKPLVKRVPAANRNQKILVGAMTGLSHRCHANSRLRRAFTLIELLVVIAIIATLAALLFPVLATVKRKARITEARAQMHNIEAAVLAYQSTYTLAPTPKPLPFNPPTQPSLGKDFSFGFSNSDIMVILMDIDALANQNHARNPQKNQFLHANVKPGTGPGLSSTDYNFRDPWGTPYIIAFDLDYDNNVTVPDKPDPNADPLFKKYPSINIPRSVIIWSMGPDGKAEDRSPTGSDREGFNKDNIRSWD